MWNIFNKTFNNKRKKSKPILIQVQVRQENNHLKSKFSRSISYCISFLVSHSQAQSLIFLYNESLIGIARNLPNALCYFYPVERVSLYSCRSKNLTRFLLFLEAKNISNWNDPKECTQALFSIFYLNLCVFYFCVLVMTFSRKAMKLRLRLKLKIVLFHLRVFQFLPKNSLATYVAANLIGCERELGLIGTFYKFCRKKS